MVTCERSHVLWVCGCVDVWLCGCVAVWLCGCVAVWLRGCVAVWLCGCVAVQVCGVRAAERRSLPKRGFIVHAASQVNADTPSGHGLGYAPRLSSQVGPWCMVATGYWRVRGTAT